MWAWKLAISPSGLGAELWVASVISASSLSPLVVQERQISGTSVPAASDRTDRREAGLRKGHAVGDMARLTHVEIERKHRVRSALLGPTDQPAKRAVLVIGETSLGADDRVAHLGHRQNLDDQILAAFRNRQRPPPQPIDAHLAPHPELVDAAADVVVAVVEEIDILLHSLLTDPPCDLLIDGKGRDCDRRTQGVILVPCLIVVLDAVPLEHVLVGIADHAGLQRDQ